MTTTATTADGCGGGGGGGGGDGVGGGGGGGGGDEPCLQHTLRLKLLNALRMGLGYELSSSVDCRAQAWDQGVLEQMVYYQIYPRPSKRKDQLQLCQVKGQIGLQAPGQRCPCQGTKLLLLPHAVRRLSSISRTG